MDTERPKIKVSLEPLDAIAEIFTLSLLALLIIYTFIVFQELLSVIEAFIKK